ncbi:hypothetical protein LIER_14690 [Lithospermum erythrorhizon]|uniref:FBD domain-containing protein n=1 Tax=Lithospermum erythrorhizon TaxID=34254 RepID=A0AAV3Q0G9_LITER
MIHDVIKNSIIKGIQYLDLFVKDGPIVCLPSNLFTSQTLEVLRLGGGSILISVPNFVSLPNLRKMELVKVKYHDDESARMLITSCVNLEVLVVELTKPDNVDILNISSSTLRKIFVSYVEVIYHKCVSGYSKKKNILINAPPLQYLSLSDVSGSVYCSLGNFPSLEEVDIDMNVSLDGRNDYSYRLTSFYQAIKHVKVLTINEDIFKVPVPEHLFPMFHMLTVLKVTTSCCGWGMLENFLKNSPKLENLIFTVGSWSFHHHDLRWRNPESVPACLLSSLKSISIFSSTLYKVELAMAKYILKNARVLRTMKIKDHHSPGSKKEKKFHNVLLNVRRGSDSCEVSIC